MEDHAAESSSAELPSPQSEYPQLLSLGMVIAERCIVRRDRDGRERQVLIKLGMPVPTLPSLYRCPLQIVGLDNDAQILSPAGSDGIEAIFNALHLAGQILDLKANELGLMNRHEGTEPTIPNWTWKYQSTE